VRVLDLFCGQGGAARGYHDAGFGVTGVDHVPQPGYPFTFVLSDALAYPLGERDPPWSLIHASPPCQAYTSASAKARKSGTAYPDLIPEARVLLEASGIPWIIENVPGSPLGATGNRVIMLCGFSLGLPLARHRRFELSPQLAGIPAPSHRAHALTATPHPATRPLPGEFWTVAGHPARAAGDAMGIDWMTSDGLAQAVPPAYTAYLARHAAALLGLSRRDGRQ
jgi:DNA (cytosine-5)-methyltransferase 1